MKKVIAFDLDNTLALLGKGIEEENIRILKHLEDRGHTIAIVSGKPTYYLTGFMRQVGLKNPILVGENGAVIQYGVDLPPKKNYILPYSLDAKGSIKLLDEEIRELYPDMFFQPNLVGLTPFPRNEEEFDKIQEIIDKNKENLKDIEIYRHSDSFDIVPNNHSKYSGMEKLSELLNIPRENVIAVGDGVNDYPMFDFANLALGINVSEPEKVDKVFNSITEALKFLDSYLE